MTDIDTSADAVERLAEALTYWEVMDCTREEAAELQDIITATLRALARERDKAREARTVAIQQMCEHARAAGSWQGMAEGKDIVIRQLEAEVASLRECNAELQMSAGAADLAMRRVTAERDRMREALQRIAGISNECTWTPRMRPLAAELQDIIRAALSGGAP